MENDERTAILDVARFLSSKIGKGIVVEEEESTRLAVKYICESYRIEPSELSTTGISESRFLDIYLAGLRSQRTSASDPQRGINSQQSKLSEPAFVKFLDRLKSTTKFFDGVSEGSSEYDERVTRARSKFEARLAEKLEKTRPPQTVGSASASNVSPSDGDAVPVQGNQSEVARKIREEEAERLKEEGNVQLKAREYEAANSLYSEAIAMNDCKATYYSNRAAALIHLGRFSEAVSDCERALGIDGNFLRARERLASAYRKLGMFDLEYETLVTAARLHPSEKRLEIDVKAAAERKRVGRDDAMAMSPGDTPRSGVQATPRAAEFGHDAQSAGPGTGMPDLSSLMGGLQGMNGGDMSGLLSMASSIAADPAVAQMVQDATSSGQGPQDILRNVMQNPELMQTMMQSMGSMFGPPPPGPGAS